MYSHFIPIDLKEYTVSRTDTPLIKRLSSTGTLLNFEYRFHPQNTDFHRIFSLKKKKSVQYYSTNMIPVGSQELNKRAKPSEKRKRRRKKVSLLFPSTTAQFIELETVDSSIRLRQFRSRNLDVAQDCTAQAPTDCGTE